MNSFVLTSLGKSEAEKMSSSGPRFAIVSFLYEMDGPVDFEEITERLNTSDEKASMLLNSMLNEQSPLIKGA